MPTVTILGAGGNMGRRITRALRENASYSLNLVEPSEEGRRLIREVGLEVVDLDDGLAGAQIVVFAVPDRIVRDVAVDVLPRLDPGTSILFLDPAAVAAGRIQRRDDIQCYVAHPTHPPLYSIMDEADAAARRDYWGGGLASQAVVFAVAWEMVDRADAVEQLAIDMFAPVIRSHRITVDQMAMLEPALTETLTNGCIAIIHEGMQRVIAAGVPEQATRDFLMGHLQIGIALIFGQLDWKLSEGAQLALDKSRAKIFREDWQDIFRPDQIMLSLKQITGGD